MGRLIPAGTGLAAYKKLNVVIEGEGEERYTPAQPATPSMTAVNEE